MGKLGLVNSLGIPSKGSQVICSYLRGIKAKGRPIILNITPTTPKKLKLLLKIAEEIDVVRFVEVNISCPNNFKNVEVWEALEAIERPGKPTFIKLGPTI